MTNKNDRRRLRVTISKFLLQKAKIKTEADVILTQELQRFEFFLRQIAPILKGDLLSKAIFELMEDINSQLEQLEKFKSSPRITESEKDTTEKLIYQCSTFISFFESKLKNKKGSL